MKSVNVILREDISTLGDMGDTVSVRAGYARNYLLPKKLAVVADDRNIKALEHEKRIIEQRAKKVKVTAESLSADLQAVELSFTAKAGEEGKLFGSITSINIAEQLKEKGFDIDRRRIIIDEPIKSLGDHTVNVKLHRDVVTPVKITVEAEEGSAVAAAPKKAAASDTDKVAAEAKEPEAASTSPEELPSDTLEDEEE